MLYVVMLLLTQLIFQEIKEFELISKLIKKILIKRFKQRENITENTFDKNIELYYKSYEETLKDSVSNILDTTDKDIIEKINKFI